MVVTLRTKIESLDKSEISGPIEVQREMCYDKMFAMHDAACRVVSGMTGTSCKVTNVTSTLYEFGKYLAENKVGKYFHLNELVTPNHKPIAKDLGYDVFVPPWIVWPQAVGLLFIADAIRDAIGNPVTLRNYWRPNTYNRRVSSSPTNPNGSGINSDHPNGCSFDLDFASEVDREIASWMLLGMHRTNRLLEMSIGLGGRSIHVGILSPKRSRLWTYQSYKGPKLDW